MRARFGIIALCVALLGAAPATVPTTAPASLSLPAQHALVSKLLAQYHKPGLTPDARDHLVEQVLALDSGPKELAATATHQFNSDSSAYASRYESDALKVIHTRAQKVADIEERVADLRKRVLAVALGARTTHEMVHTDADPPMKELTSIMDVARDEVFAVDAPLKDQRAALFALLHHRAQAAALLPAPVQKHLAALPEPAAYEKQLAESEELAACLVTPMSNNDQKVLLHDLEVAKQMDPAEGRGVFVLNKMRIRLGIGALIIDPKLCDAARGHSQEMKDKGYFDHISPTPGLSTPWDRAGRAGTTASGENIFMGSDSGDTAIEEWWYSPGHLKNMMSPHLRIGLGRVGGYWTMMLGD